MTGDSEHDGAVIRLDGVSVRFRVPLERIGTFKEYAIRLLQRRIRYETLWALKEVTLAIDRGEVFGVIGANGAGKSTLARVVARVLYPTEGRVRVTGRVAPLIGIGAGFHPELTGRENVLLNGAMLGFTRAQMEEKLPRIIAFAELHEFIDAPLRTYSSGMVVRLGFAAATDAEPDVLIVDEVLAVGDEAFREKSRARMLRFQERGVTTLLISHDMHAVRASCRRAAWLDRGRLRAVGSAGDVVDAYLGSLTRPS
jgi:ABC-type polysaccharide/polyol phosphate transport system ATPase subunit